MEEDTAIKIIELYIKEEIPYEIKKVYKYLVEDAIDEITTTKIKNKFEEKSFTEELIERLKWSTKQTHYTTTQTNTAD